MKRANFFIVTILFLVSFAYLNLERAWGADNDIQKYKIASGLIKAGKLEMAIDHLKPLSVKSFILGDYAAKDLASIMALGALKDEALKTLDSIENNFPRSPLLRQINEERLRLACDTPATDSCSRHLKDISDKDVAKKFRPFRKLYIAKRKEAKGDIKAAYKLYQQIYYGHPAAPSAIKAGIYIEKIKSGVGGIDKNDLPYPSYAIRMKRAKALMKAYRYTAAAKQLELILNIPYTKARKAKVYILLGEALNRSRDRKEAKETLLSFIDKYKRHKKKMEMEYRIAIIDWNLDKNEESKRRLEKLIGSGASKNIKEMSHSVLGKMAESKKDFVLAKVHYEKALRLHPKPRQRHELMWRLGWIEYQKREYAASAKIFADAIKKIAIKYRDGKFLYWRAKSLIKTDDSIGGGKAYKEVKRLFPNTFYGTKRVDDDDGATEAMSLPEMNSFYETVEKIADKLKFNKRAKYHRKRFNILIGIELYEQAATELGALKKYGPKGGEPAIWMGLQYRKAKASSKAIRLLTDSSGIIKHGFDFTAPFWRLLYPVDHWESIIKEAKNNDLDPFFVLAIIRQESGFDSKALSPANARGLMQLIPSVGKKEFSKNSFAGYSGVTFNSDLLFDPTLNISIGVKHLASLKKKYNGNIVYISAAYNAGSKAVDIWKKRFDGATIDEFVELIPYRETRGYVKIVLKNLALYRLIYGKSDARLMQAN